jgi:hypothetical protein
MACGSGWTPADREIVRLAVPAFGALIAQPLYVLADTAVVGHLGTPELAGLAIANTVLATLYAVFIFLAYGTTSAVAASSAPATTVKPPTRPSRASGCGGHRGRPRRRRRGARRPPRPDPRRRGRGGRQRPDLPAGEPARVPATLVTFAGVGYLRGLQNTRVPLVVAVASAVFNLVFEMFLIYGLGFGIGASAASTVVAEYGAAAVYIWWVHRAVATHEVALRPHAETLGSLLVVGRDLFFRTVACGGRSPYNRRAPASGLPTPPPTRSPRSARPRLDAIAIAGQSITGFRLCRRRHRQRAPAEDARVGRGGGLLSPASRDGAPRPPTCSPTTPVVALATFLLLFVAFLQPVNGAVFVLDGLHGAGDLRFLAKAMVGAWSPSCPPRRRPRARPRHRLAVGRHLLFMVARLVPLSWRFAGDARSVLGRTTNG